jgi:hypothetical protein
VIVVDTDVAAQITYDLVLGTDGLYEPDQEAPFARPLSRNPKRLENDFTWSEEGDDFATDLGLPVSHNRRDRITLDDLFVYPYVKVASSPIHTSQKQTARLSAEKLEWTGNHTLVVGSELSGKTTLAKKLFADLRRLVDGRGGSGVTGSKAACDGTAGGDAGNGGPGGGGNGGHSIGVLYVGKLPKLIDVIGEAEVVTNHGGEAGLGPAGVDPMLAMPLTATAGVAAFTYQM